jgi:hypothetical protein
MKNILPLLAAIALGTGACQKHPSEAEKKSKIERRARQRLDAEHRAAERKLMPQRQADLERRIIALAARQRHATESPTPTNSASSATSATSSAPDARSDFYSTFYRKLEPYGDWMEAGEYGYVFQPQQAAQAPDWRPYTNGHWIYTDVGWTWISEEKFGWATYHYGRWIRLRDIGWVWVPGEQWAPAWVSWRKGGDYVGWAPLPPEAQFDRETGIHNWADNYYDIGPEQYSFVPTKEFGSQLSSREIVPNERNLTIINQTSNVTNIVYDNSMIVDPGPSYEDLRAQSRQPIKRYRLQRTNESNREAPVFRGEVVSLPTVEFHPGERGGRPNRVVRTIAQPVVERGWTGIGNTPAAQQVRAKMQAEATPPPNPPPKRFVRPKQENAIPSRSVPTTPGQIVSPAVSAATAIPIGTPAPLPSNPPPAPPRPTAVATATASPRPSPTAREESPANLDKASAAAQRRMKRADKRARKKQASPAKTPEPDASPQ